MTKQEAAEYLGVSVRTLDVYAHDKNKLNIKYIKGKRGKVAQFDESELERLKQERDAEANSAYAQKPALVARESESLAIIEQGSQRALDAVVSLGERFSTAIESLKANSVPIESKLTLTLSDASALAGLSRNFLLDAIHSKKLTAAKRGRGWNIKRADLDSFVKKL